MKTTVDAVGNIRLSEVYETIAIDFEEGSLYICERDGKLEMHTHIKGKEVSKSDTDFLANLTSTSHAYTCTRRHIPNAGKCPDCSSMQ